MYRNSLREKNLLSLIINVTNFYFPELTSIGGQKYCKLIILTMFQKIRNFNIRIASCQIHMN